MVFDTPTLCNALESTVIASEHKVDVASTMRSAFLRGFSATERLFSSSESKVEAVPATRFPAPRLRSSRPTTRSETKSTVVMTKSMLSVTKSMLSAIKSMLFVTLPVLSNQRLGGFVDFELALRDKEHALRYRERALCARKQGLWKRARALARPEQTLVGPEPGECLFDRMHGDEEHGVRIVEGDLFLRHHILRPAKLPLKI